MKCLTSAVSGVAQTPFPLTLRLWDIFILEGERLLTAMSYTILKTHKRKTFPSVPTVPTVYRRWLKAMCVFVSAEHLLKMSLEELRDFLQERISRTLLLSDDVMVEQLQASMTELRKMKLDLPPPGA